MVGMKHNLKHVFEIAQTATDPRVKVQDRAIANDCYRYMTNWRQNSQEKKIKKGRELVFVVSFCFNVREFAY